MLQIVEETLTLLSLHLNVKIINILIKLSINFLNAATFSSQLRDLQPGYICNSVKYLLCVLLSIKCVEFAEQNHSPQPAADAVLNYALCILRLAGSPLCAICAMSSECQACMKCGCIRMRFVWSSDQLICIWQLSASS